MFTNFKSLFVKNAVTPAPEIPGHPFLKNSNFGLANHVEGAGTGRSIATYNTRNPVPYTTWAQIDEMYRSNWMARKLIDTPASDMTRNWREFYHEDSNVITERLYAEKVLKVKDTVRLAVQWSGLYGGAAIVMHFKNDDDLAAPLNLTKIKKGDLRLLQVVFKDQIQPSTQIELDPYSDNYQKPKFYTITGAKGNSIVHASKVICFYGAELPLYSLLRQNSWGDSRLTSAWAVLEAAESIWLSIAQLISQSNIDVIKLKDYTTLLARGGENMANDLLCFQERMTSNYKKLILDTEDEYERKELTGLQGMAEVMIQYLQMIAGSQGMPLSKFLGTSVGGFSTGDNEITEWYDVISERQNRIFEQMNYLDKVIEFSTFGKFMDIRFEWNSLREMDDSEKYDIDLKRAQRDEINLRLGVVDEAMIAEGLKEDGVYSSIDPDWIQALKDAPPTQDEQDELGDQESEMGEE